MTDAPVRKPPSRLAIALAVLAVLAIGWLFYTGSFSGGDAPGGPPPGRVTRAEFGDKWPLTIDEGTLECTADRSVILHTSSGTYAVNGTARAQMEKQGWKDLRTINAPDSQGAGLLISAQPLVDRGLTLCR